MKPAPIAIMSFNRPELLKRILKSILLQRGAAIEDRQVHLFQDNAINKYSGITYTDKKLVHECVDIFRAYFPSGTVHLSSNNIGICENFDRAERYFFEKNDFECAYFFEDDLELGRDYIHVMEKIQTYAKISGNIAYFACYGDLYSSSTSTQLARRSLVPLDHSWGFGLFAKHWRAIEREIQFYLGIVKGNDYKRRNHRAVYDHYKASGLCPRGSSQDAAKTWACARLGLARIMTIAPFAKYIGADGAHMSKALFDQMGFEKIQALQEPIRDFIWPTADDLGEMISKRRDELREIAETEFDALRTNLPPEVFSPRRVATRKDVQNLYRLLMGVNSAPEAVLDSAGGRSDLASLVHHVLGSGAKEALLGEGLPAGDSRAAPCTRDDILLGYELLMHRRPESEEVIVKQVGKMSIQQFLQQILTSDEMQKFLRIEAVPLRM